MTSRSFSLVDHKVAEAEFFLRQIPSCGYDFFAVRCYVSAFVASIRSVTFSLQSVMKHMDGFDEWYKRRQDELRQNPLAKFFHDFRTVNQHTGDNLVSGGSSKRNAPTLYWFSPTSDLQVVPETDVETACKDHFTAILQLIYDCYSEFGPVIDAKQHYTAEHCATLGKTVEDIELELFGLPRGLAPKGFPVEYRWQYIRDQMTGCEINDIFEHYLGKVTPEPARLPSLDKQNSNEKTAWVVQPESSSNHEFQIASEEQ